MSAFHDVSDVYDNVKASRIVRHEIANRAISEIMRWSSKLFQVLDRSDPVQADISRRLWVLRSSVIFTLLPFDDPSVALTQQMADLAKTCAGLPDQATTIESLSRAVDNIASHPANPKLEWIRQTIDLTDDGLRTGMPIGILARLSAGRAPGWPSDMESRLPEFMRRIAPIHSRTDLRSSLFERLILPCACRNMDPFLLQEVVHSGRSRIIDVILYSEERFVTPKRLTLPGCRIFDGRIQRTRLEQEASPVPEATPVDAWANEAFWQAIHGAERSAGKNLVAAHYVLFSDGTGTFFPANGRIPVLPASGELRHESDLRIVHIGDLSEDDRVVIRVGDSNFLLDEASDRLMQNDAGNNLISEATDWKSALEALLITHSCDEIASCVRDLGVLVSASSVHQWAGPDVLGPGNEKVFIALIEVLGNKGKLVLDGDALHQYAARKWRSLQELRGVRHRAGNLIRQELLQKLVTRFQDGIGDLGDRTSIRIEGDAATELAILKVSSADQSVAFVQPSLLGRPDDHRGNPWLG